MKEIQLKVCEANEEDVGKGLIRIDVKMMEELGVKLGDTVEIEGGKRTTALVGESGTYAYSGPDFIRIDGKIRWNAGTQVRETVKVRKVRDD